MFPRYSRTLIPALAAIALAGAVPVAGASPPFPPLCTVPHCIPLVGSNNGVVDAAGEFVVVVRGIANNAIAGATTVVDFGNCGGVALGDAAAQAFPGISVDCTRHRVSAISDATGIARFRLVGGGAAGGTTPGPASACAFVYADNQPLGAASVQLYDLDGANGVGGNDLSLWMADFFARGNPERSRSDYDCNGGVGGNDLALWLGVFNAGGSASSASACP